VHAGCRVVAGLVLSACAVYDEQHVVTSNPLESPPAAATAEVEPLQPDAAAAPPSVDPEPCVEPTEVDPCDALPRLAAPAKLDGTVECGLTLHALAGSPQSTASYAAAYSDNGFYIYLEVHAPPSPVPAPTEPLYCGDAVEIFVDSDGQPGTDGAYNAPGTMQFVVSAPRGSDMITGRFLAGTSQGPWITSNLQVRSLEDGYAVEAVIVGSDLGLWSWTPNAQLGFNLAVNRAGTGEPRSAPCTTGVGQSVLRVAAPRMDCDGKPWCDTRSFCWPVLGD
jgi:hypothetical protein